MRGNRVYGPPAHCHVGSIPACAGEPIDRERIDSIREVYPRVCGGTIGSRSAISQLGGLSPRVRGNPPPACYAMPPYRSIPACAGEPNGNGHDNPPAGVYPRVCGGTVTVKLLPTSTTGLSPRVRGNPARVAATGRRRRSIPACAGEPRLRTAPLAAAEVYPRVCGGTVWSIPCRSSPAGLSPRVRGNRLVRRRCTRY